MELLSHKLELIKKNRQSIRRKPRMNTSDIERIHYAAEILVKDLVYPPGITDIAVEIGMSRSKLYRSFKIVFGYSPMGYLRRHRLQTARQLLLQGKYNVTEVAFAVGFNNLSYFSRAFVAEFSVQPHQII